MSLPLAPQQKLVVAIASLASFVAFLDGSVVNVALPAISEDLGGGLTTQQWAVDAYLITLGALILLAGSCSDAFGRIRIMRIGLIGFGIASIAVALAPSPVFLIVARAAQGAAGAFLVPSSLALITSTIRGPRQGKAIGAWTALTTGAFVAGPAIGGMFVDLLSWRYVFAINVVPIAVTLWLLTRLEARDVRRPGVRIDWIGGAMCTFGLGAAVYALIEQPHYGWTAPGIWIPLVVGIVLLVAFVMRQKTTAAPILPLSLFRIRNFSAGNAATLFIYAALSLNGFVVVVYLQQEAGLPATLAGLAGLPTTVLLIVLSSRMGALAGRWGPRLFMTVGPMIMAIGSLLLLTVREDFSYWWQVLPSMIVFGVGLGTTVSPLTAGILGAVDTERSGIASAVNNAVARIAGLLVIAALAAIVGGALDLDGFYRAAIVTAVLLAIGGVVSFVGIRNEDVATDDADASNSTPASEGTTPS